MNQHTFGNTEMILKPENTYSRYGSVVPRPSESYANINPSINTDGNPYLKRPEQHGPGPIRTLQFDQFRGPDHSKHDRRHMPCHFTTDQFQAQLGATFKDSALHNMVHHSLLDPMRNDGASNMISMQNDSQQSDIENERLGLELFAENFKQRRTKLGVTQADVGAALGNLKIAGVGCLSQSTICRFESLTLSHNNMMALKPVLAAWLEKAEEVYKSKQMSGNCDNTIIPQRSDKKRKRTSIAAMEKRALEAYFAIEPRPSSEKIAIIAEKLDLQKNVVRVWFCNQRQKQKRMKFAQ